jgi:Tfp pilus assembly protein PilW
MRQDGAQRRDGGEAGFSLVELLIAMTITMVISGAIFGLLAGGQTAFRREPELSDRQQAIRVAMDVILRDVANAGSGMPIFTQTFTPGLDACAACPMGAGGANTDELEILTNSASRENEPACIVAGGGLGAASEQVRLVRANSTIAPQTTVVLAMDDGRYTVRNVTAVGNNGVPADNCAAGPHVELTFGTGGDTTGMNVAGTLCSPNAFGVGDAVAPCDVAELSFGEVVRYRVRPDADGVPVLQRSSSSNPAAGFQVIARGIDDFQVQYAPIGAPPAAAVWTDNAPPVAFNGWNTLITQVRVTLSARSEAQNIEGATNAPAGPAAMRGQLTAIASPRSTLLSLTRQVAPPAPPGAPAPPPANIWR